MIFSLEDSKKLAKVGIFSAIDLALEAPKGYEDTRLSNALPNEGGILCAKALSQGVSVFGKTLSVKLYLPELDKNVEAMFFNFKPYLKASFAIDKEMIIYGQIKRFAQIIHPKILTHAGFIAPIYKPPFNRAPYPELRKKYITITNLEEDGLPLGVAQILYKAHFPDDEVLRDESNKTLQALKFAEIFNHLKELKKRKIEFPALALKTKNIQNFYKTLPYEPTVDQKKAIEDITKDLAKNIQMRRLVIGDVGSGKTLVILAAAWLIAPIKTILMAPTTILANQLYEQALTLIPTLKTALVTATHDDKNLALADLIIGTHALLYREIPNAGLVIVDEQHRFGVSQRAQISKLAENGELRPHYLQCSATPIPRTQALIEAQMAAVSLIKTLPFEKKIDTKIIGKESFKELLAHIDAQAASARQTAIIYPLVEESEHFNYQSIEEGAPFWQKRYQNVIITHGRDKNKEEALETFRERGDVLISTTVIEVGISLPRLDTIVIVGAERLGLASLHQLRGRVGRYGNLGHCFLYTLNPKNERLIEFCKIKDGFEVAELDLKFRSSGDVVSGKRQSGVEFIYFNRADDYEIAKKAAKAL